MLNLHLNQQSTLSTTRTHVSTAHVCAFHCVQQCHTAHNSSSSLLSSRQASLRRFCLQEGREHSQHTDRVPV